MEHLEVQNTKLRTQILECPRCSSKKIWKDGKRKTVYGSVQRFLCKDCGHRYSGSIIFSTPSDRTGECQVCVTRQGAKNLIVAKQEEQATGDISDTKSILFQFAWWMKRQGYAEQTITSREKILRILSKRGADLYDGESVKAMIAKQDWSQGRKRNAVHAYSSFLKMIGGKWEPSRYRRIPKIP